MKNLLSNLAKNTRSKLTRIYKPKEKYWFDNRSLKPLSEKAGFDRGTPIDRYYIDKFLSINREYVKGVCLEVGDNRYTRKFGGGKVLKSDIVDVNKNNKKATISADLRNLEGIGNNSYNCIILTQVLGLIDDYDAAIKEIFRILKPGGVVLLTSTCLNQTRNPDSSYWRFTPKGLQFVFERYFKDKLKIESYGNVLVSRSMLVGLSQEELTLKELDYFDPHYPCVLSLRGQKP